MAADRLSDPGRKWQKPTPEVVRQRLGWWSWFTAVYWFLSGIGIGVFIGWGIWVTHAF